MTPASLKARFRDWELYLFIVPALALVVTFSYLPAASAIYHSFFQWQGDEAKSFVGLGNFAKAMGDSTFWRSFGVIGILVVANLFKMIPSIFLAVLIHRLRGETSQYVYRVLLVIPMVVPGLITLFIWKFFFNPNMGILNRILEVTGLIHVLTFLDHLLGVGAFQPGMPPAWLGEPALIIPSLIIWGFPWVGAIGVLIFLAGLGSIGTEVYEAAELDGVSSFQKFLYIELPLILTQMRLNIVLMIIATLQGFGLQLLLLGENGGPNSAGMVPGLWMFNRAFIAGEFGYACALGLILFVAILALTYVNNRFVRVDK